FRSPPQRHPRSVASRDRTALRDTVVTVRTAPGNAPAGTAERTADGLMRGHGHGAYERWIRRVQMLLLREVAEAGRAADLRPRGVHLRGVHRAVQRDHRRGDPGRPARLPGAGAAARPAGDLRLPRAVRRRPGA